MTRNASHRANYVTRKSNHSLTSNRLRNPWLLEQQGSGIVPSSNSSQGRAPTYCTLSGPGPPMYSDNVSEQRLKYYHTQPDTKSLTIPRQKSHQLYSGYLERVPSVRMNPVVLPKDHHQTSTKFFDRATFIMNSGCSTSRTSSDRPMTPVSLSTTDGVVDPCGGHCKTFERCCHYLLQAIFIIGILLGVSLVLAAYWLHSQRRRGDQLVLVYIGVVIVMVCTLLLSIQCSVERDVKRKKRSRRATATLLARNRGSSEMPMRDLGSGVARAGYVSREAEDVVAGQNLYSHMPLLYSPYQYESQSKSWDEMSQSQNGIPWWRSNN